MIGTVAVSMVLNELFFDTVGVPVMRCLSCGLIRLPYTYIE